METTRRVVSRYVLGVDSAIHLLDHLEVLMDSVARIGVERRSRARQLERPRQKLVDVGDAQIWTLVVRQTCATGSEQELSPGRQPRIARRQEAGIGRKLHAVYVGRRQRR